MSDFVRVSRKRPCEICGSPDWCSYLAKGSLAFCMRESRGSVKTAANGAFIHRLKESPAPLRRRAEPPRSAIVEPAPVERRHEVYCALLDALDLTDEHLKAGERRGLSRDELFRLRYKSTPDAAKASALALDLSKRFDLRGVPGFRSDPVGWRMIETPEGFFAPCLDAHGRVRAMQYRLDASAGGGKYRWFSSRDCSSGTPVHFARGHLLGGARELVITEGIVKADVISFLTGEPVVALAGVWCFTADFAARLRRMSPGLRTAIVAFDKDLRTNPAVRRALDKLTTQLEAERFGVRVRTWHGDAKGYDDYLLSQHHGEEVAT